MQRRNPSLIIQLSFLPAAGKLLQKLEINMNLKTIWSEYIINKVTFNCLFSLIKISYDSFVKTREEGIDRCKYAWVGISLNGHYIYASTSFKYLFTHEPKMKYGNKVAKQEA